MIQFQKLSHLPVSMRKNPTASRSRAGGGIGWEGGARRKKGQAQMRGRGGKIRDGREKGESELGKERATTGRQATQGAGHIKESTAMKKKKKVDKRYQELLITTQEFKHSDKEAHTHCYLI